MVTRLTVGRVLGGVTQSLQAGKLGKFGRIDRRIVISSPTLAARCVKSEGGVACVSYADKGAAFVDSSRTADDLS